MILYAVIICTTCIQLSNLLIWVRLIIKSNYVNCAEAHFYMFAQRFVASSNADIVSMLPCIRASMLYLYKIKFLSFYKFRL